MRFAESQLHSFIVKLWLEDVNEEGSSRTWGGQIKHVPGGECRHIRSLEEITNFIKPYLGTVGDEAGLSARLRRWMKYLGLRSGAG
jgi:hypothetical protein